MLYERVFIILNPLISHPFWISLFIQCKIAIFKGSPPLFKSSNIDPSLFIFKNMLKISSSSIILDIIL
jgi:hypothetical protein